MTTYNVDSKGTACPGPITDLIRAYRKASNGADFHPPISFALSFLFCSGLRPVFYSDIVRLIPLDTNPKTNR